MLVWVVLFLIFAVIAGVMGFGFVASVMTTIAQTCFFIFLTFCLISLVSEWVIRIARRRA